MKCKYSWDLLISIIILLKNIYEWHIIWWTYWRILSRDKKLSSFNELKEWRRHFRSLKSALWLCLFSVILFLKLNFIWNTMLLIMLYWLFFLNFALIVNDILLCSDLESLMRLKFDMKLMTRSCLSLLWYLNTDVIILKS